MTTTSQSNDTAVQQPVELLVIQPDEQAPLGRFTTWLADQGARITVLRPYAGDPIPAQVAADGLIVLGGTMNFDSDEQFPWLADIHALYRQAAAARIPVLGICLGAQLLAATFGGTIAVNSSRGPEIGVVEVTQTDQAAHDPIMQDLPETLYATAFHYDGISALPDGAVLLGRGKQYPNQMFRYGTAVGVQFHPEATPQLFRNWCADDLEHRPELAERFETQTQQVAELDQQISAQVVKVAHNFVQTVQAAPQMQRS